MEDRSTIGHPVAMQRFYADTNILWSYGNFVDIKGPTVMKIMTIEAIGGEVDMGYLGTLNVVVFRYLEQLLILL